jgi:hypothetical protein
MSVPNRILREPKHYRLTEFCIAFCVNQAKCFESRELLSRDNAMQTSSAGHEHLHKRFVSVEDEAADSGGPGDHRDRPERSAPQPQRDPRYRQAFAPAEHNGEIRRRQ